MTASRVARPCALRLNLLAAGVVAACGLAGGSFGIDAAHAAHAPNRNVQPAPQSHAPIDRSDRPNRQRPRHAVPAAVPDRQAGTIVVGNCDDAGPGSLRQALADAVNGDVIDLTGLACSTITLTSGALETNADVTLDGPGMDVLTISAGLASRVLRHLGSELVVNGLTLADGQYGPGTGGCTWIGGTLTMNASRVTGCVAGDGSNFSGYGAGLDVIGDLVLNDSIVSGNTTNASGGPYGGAVYGGAIYGYGSVVMSNSVVSGNSAIASGNAWAVGGGVFARGEVNLYAGSVIAANDATAQQGIARGGGLFATQQARVVASSLLDNESRSQDATAYGGGIHANGGVLVGASTISGNIAHSENAWAYGGGVQSGDDAGADGGSGILLAASTVSGNTVSSNCASCFIVGGGAHAFGNFYAKYSTIDDNHSVLGGSSTGTASGPGISSADWFDNGFVHVLLSSTVSGNTASGGNAIGYGGGIVVSNSRFFSYNSTVAFNSASGMAGGISLSEQVGDPHLIHSTIVADNSAGDGTDIAIGVFTPGAAVIDGGSNLIGAVSADITVPPDTIAGMSPILLPLAVNGGPTRTHALPGCSPAINAGSNPMNFDADQRGEPFVREFNGAVDIGAFERQPDADRIFIDGFDPGPCPPP